VIKKIGLEVFFLWLSLFLNVLNVLTGGIGGIYGNMFQNYPFLFKPRVPVKLIFFE